MPFSDDGADAKMRRRQGEDRLGGDVIDECRTQLMLRFRFLDLALWRMELEPLRAGARYPLATDARRVVYDPPRVIARFQESFEESVRDYLHLVMHCVFRHPHALARDCLEAWELTCDIIAESAAMEMCAGRFASEDDAARREAVDEIRMLAGRLLPGRVYGLLEGLARTPDGQRFRGLGREALNRWRDLFERDDHGAWPVNNRSEGQEDAPDREEEVVEDEGDPEVQADGLRAEALEGDAVEGGASDRAATDGAEDDAAGAGGDEGDALLGEGDSDEGADGGGRGLSAEDRRSEKEWEDVAKRIEMNLETFSKEWGSQAGDLMANLAFSHRRTRSYADFLRRFAAPVEEMRLNPEEFDYLPYVLGLELYGNMPLVEPLEYREEERVREFAIVIDTSESVSGDLVRRFVRHTFSLLESPDGYAREADIHLIQCDARVQADLKISDVREIDRLLEGFCIRGFGGTDFRPAFDYVDMLRRRGELTHLKGLLYFTDGYGQFPEKPPGYDAAFVFVEEEGRETPPVPPWAMKVLVDEAEIEGLEKASAARGRRKEKEGAMGHGHHLG